MTRRKLIDVSQAKLEIKKTNLDSKLTIYNSTNKLIKKLNANKNNLFDFSVFYHELCEYTDNYRKFRNGSSFLEIEISKFIDFDTILKLENVENIVRKVTEGKGVLRSSEVSLRKDKRGTEILFPEAKQSRERLVEIINHINSLNGYDFKEVVLIYVLILNSHAFTDGNGRLARIIFNTLLKRQLKHYLPIYEIKHFSNGGYEIRLRQAEIFNDWMPLFLYFVNSIQFCNQYNKK